jgi:hypothetical protein
MKITKDEARILAVALGDAKYRINDEYKGSSTNEQNNLFNALEDLENRLYNLSADMRRTGRTSLNWFSDCIKRFVNAYNKRIQ